jgi:hypothetical protein
VLFSRGTATQAPLLAYRLQDGNPVEHAVGWEKVILEALETYCRAVDEWLTCAPGSPPPSSKPGHRHMDSDNVEQHDNHIQRDDDHEQDDENPQNGRDERQSIRAQ